MEIILDLCVTGTITIDENEPLHLSASPVVSAVVGIEYPGFQLAASGGSGGYVYSVAEGSLPTGLSLDSETGIVSGTPTEAGSFSGIVFAVTDSDMTVATAGPFTISVTAFLLDGIGAAAGAWSLARRLSSVYEGPAIRVRRSSDNAQQDIGFDEEDLDVAALLTFCGAGDGFVVTIYDQSGNSRNFTQATTGAQARIVDTGALVTQGARAAIEATGDQYYQVPSSTSLFNFLHNGSDATFYARATSGSFSQSRMIASTTDDQTTNRPGYSFRTTSAVAAGGVVVNASGVAYSALHNSGASSIVLNQPFVAVELIDANAAAADRLLVSIDGGSLVGNNVDTTAPTTNNATADLTLLRTIDTFSSNNYSRWIGFLQEVVIWEGHMDVSDIYDNASAFYTS